MGMINIELEKQHEWTRISTDEHGSRRRHLFSFPAFPSRVGVIACGASCLSVVVRVHPCCFDWLFAGMNDDGGERDAYPFRFER
jgi:hypothetical protein